MAERFPAKRFQAVRHPMWLIAAALAAVLASWPAAAQTAAEDSRVVASCIAGAGDDLDKIGACIGRVADPCMEKPEGQSTAGANACVSRETEIWDRLLNADYQKVLAGLDLDKRTKVRDMQRSWIAARDRKCELIYALGGGTMHTTMAGYCILRETALQVIYLRKLEQQ
jgi:uncharacterized protein YecT (DUF1311 family)